MDAEPAAHPAAPAADATGGADAAPALKTEPGAETAPEAAVAAAASAGAAEAVAGAADSAVKAEGAAQDGAEMEEEPGLPPLPSTVQLLQESCGWAVNGRIEVRRLFFAATTAETPRMRAVVRTSAGPQPSLSAGFG